MDRDACFEVMRELDVGDAAHGYPADLHLIAADELAGFSFPGGSRCRRRRRTRGRPRSEPRSRAPPRRACGPRAAAAPRRPCGSCAAAARSGVEAAARMGRGANRGHLLHFCRLGAVRLGAAGARAGPTAAPADPLPPGTGVPGLSGTEADEGPPATVGSGISPRRAISLIHSLALSTDPKADAARAPLPPLGGLNATYT